MCMCSKRIRRWGIVGISIVDEIEVIRGWYGMTVNGLGSIGVMRETKMDRRYSGVSAVGATIARHDVGGGD